MMLPTSSIWTQRFEQERTRLRAALGVITAGGLIEAMQHIGATSVDGLDPAGGLDIALSVWPFPLPAEAQQALATLGYQTIPMPENAPEQRYRHTEAAQHLIFVEAGSDRWLEYQIIRDYLRAHASARAEHQAHRTPEAKGVFFNTLRAPAQAWWLTTHGFTPIETIARELSAFSGQWAIASGWALDLFLGRVTRLHHDADIVVARADQLLLQSYLVERGWSLVTPFEKRLEPWPKHMRLELPRHQIHAHRAEAFIDILLTDMEAGVWRYRRNPRIVCAETQALWRTPTGWPCLSPELILLFKSQNTSDKERGKDAIDFETVAPHLNPEQRAWLRWALIATDPQHAWIEQLR